MTMGSSLDDVRSTPMEIDTTDAPVPLTYMPSPPKHIEHNVGYVGSINNMPGENCSVEANAMDPEWKIKAAAVEKALHAVREQSMAQWAEAMASGTVYVVDGKIVSPPAPDGYSWSLGVRRPRGRRDRGPLDYMTDLELLAAWNGPTNRLAAEEVLLARGYEFNGDGVLMSPPYPCRSMLQEDAKARLIWWPDELQFPIFDGEPGNYTVYDRVRDNAVMALDAIASGSVSLSLFEEGIVDPEHIMGWTLDEGRAVYVRSVIPSDRLIEDNSALAATNERLRDEIAALTVEKNALHDRVAAWTGVEAPSPVQPRNPFRDFPGDPRRLGVGR